MSVDVTAQSPMSFVDSDLQPLNTRKVVNCPRRCLGLLRRVTGARAAKWQEHYFGYSSGPGCLGASETRLSSRDRKPDALTLRKSPSRIYTRITEASMYDTMLHSVLTAVPLSHRSPTSGLVFPFGHRIRSSGLHLRQTGAFVISSINNVHQVWMKAINLVRGEPQIITGMVRIHFFLSSESFICRHAQSIGYLLRRGPKAILIAYTDTDRCSC